MTLSLPDSFFRNARNPMWVYEHTDLRILDVNDAAIARYGFSREEFLGMTLYDLRSEEEQEILRRDRSANRVWQHITKSGDVLFVEVHAFPFEFGGAPATLVMASDVTDRVRLERERIDLLKHYQILSEAANDLLWDWNIKTNQVTHNEALVTQYGYERSDLQQPIEWWSDKIHPDDYSAATWTIQEAMRQGQRYWTSEYRLKKADGTWVQVLDRGIIQFDENEQPLRMVGNIVDLTQRRAAEDERKQLFRLSIDSMLLLDPSGTITQANAAFYKLAGVDAEADSRTNFREYVSAENCERFDTAVRATLADGNQGHFVTSIDTEAGRGRTVQWGLITNEARNRLFLVGRDITEENAARRQLEEALVRSQELAIEAEAARRAQSEFLQNMSHELRTPMNGMLGTAQILEESATDEHQRLMSSTLVRSGESLLQILNDILDISKIESDNIALANKPFSLGEAVQLVFDLFVLAARQKGIDFTVQISPEADVVVRGDPFRLRQIVSNLVGNGIKFTDKGSIHMSLDVVRNGSRLDATLVVRDTGIGIPPRAQARVFDRFYQVDSSPTRRHGGTGLGLSISKQVVGLMGGQLSLASKVGKGTEFTVHIPFEATEESVAKRPTKGSAAKASKQGTKVLIAEDVEVNAMILTNWLEERRFECDVASTGREAIHALSTASYDGAFVDLHMPEASGYDVIRLVRTAEEGTDRRLPVVAVTASVSQEERQRCFAEGFDDYIPKPILVADLDRVVKRLFSQVA